MTTECDAPLQLPELTDKQLAAINALVSGAGDREAADAAGVHRVTVTRWRLYNPAFRARLNERRADLWRSSLDRLRDLLPKALDRLQHEIERERGDWRAAARLLELAGASGHAPVDPATTPTTPSGVLEAELTRRSAPRSEAAALGTSLDAVDPRPDPELRAELLAEWSRRGGLDES